MGSEALDLPGDEVASDNPTSASVDDDDIEHLVAGVELDGTLTYLTAQGGVSTEQELLPRLATSIEGT